MGRILKKIRSVWSRNPGDFSLSFNRVFVVLMWICIYNDMFRFMFYNQIVSNHIYLELQTTSFFNGCFNWMFPNHYVKNGCLGYQVLYIPNLDMIRSGLPWTRSTWRMWMSSMSAPWPLPILRSGWNPLQPGFNSFGWTIRIKRYKVVKVDG